MSVCVWQQTGQKGDAPEPRSGHTLSVLNSYAYMFGGCGSKGGVPTAFNDVYTLDFSDTETFRWAKLDMGDQPAPPPRARHTATVIGEGKILVFGGLDRRKRYNDVWVLDTMQKTWTCVVPEGKAPSPRAHHSATLVDNVLWVLGGYSGHGKLSSDVYCLNLGGGEGEDATPMTWSIPNLKGKGPSPRFDHCATLFPNNERQYFTVFGGQDNTQIFREVHYLDVETLTWQEETGMSPQMFEFEVCSNFAAAIESVPNYKMFSVFGKTGLMEYSDVVKVMDVGSMSWEDPTVEGTKPPAREDMAVCYDPKLCRLFFHGGWANRWMEDLWTLNVSPIIGPPYATLSVSPIIGPVFGETEITVKGIKFRQSSKIEVRFGDGKTAATVPGEFVDRTTVKCKTPNFETFGAIEVDVKVSISGEGWTVNTVKFQYFANTSAKNSIAFGPGLEPGQGIFGVEMPFLVLARDTTNMKRSSGGDKFVVNVKMDPNVDTRGAYDLGSSTSRIIDLNNGLYEVFYSVPVAGTYLVEVLYEELGESKTLTPVKGSPFTIQASSPWTPHRVGGTAPPKRKGIAMNSNGKDALMIGGAPGMTRLNASGEACAWESMEVDGSKPADRSFPTLTALPGGTQYLMFGGVGLDDNKPLNDVHMLTQTVVKGEGEGEQDTSTWAWAPVTVADYRLRPPARPEPLKVVREGEDEEEAKPAAPPPAEENKEGEEAAAEGGEGDEAKPEGEEAKAEGDAAAEGEKPEGEVEGEAATAEAEAKAEAPKEAELAPENEPSQAAPRTSHSACSLGGKKVVMFGGESEGTLLNDFALVDLAEREPKWTQLFAKGLDLEPRKSAALAAVGTTVVLFSGIAKDEDEGEYLLDDLRVFLYEPKQHSLTLQQVEFKGPIPEPRSGAVFQLYAPNQLMLYGGVDAKGKPLNTAYLLNTAKMEWSIAYRGDPEACPPFGAVATLANGRLVTLNMQTGSSRFDAVQSMDIGEVKDRLNFAKFMTEVAERDLTSMETEVNAMEHACQLTENPSALAASFDNLLVVMGGLLDIKTKRTAIDLRQDQMKEVLSVLKSFKVNTTKFEERLEAMTVKWADVKTAAPQAKDNVAPIQATEGERIKGDIVEFGKRCVSYRQEFQVKPFFKAETGYTASYPVIDTTNTEIKKLESESSALKKLAAMFDFPELLDPADAVIFECREELVFIKDVWDISMLVEVQFIDWRKTLWADIKTDMMEDNTKAFVKEVKGLPKKIRTSNAYAGVDGSVKNFLTSIPLVADLRSPDMRERHWKMLMETTGVEFVIDDAFKLDDLLALELHKFEDEVGEIVDRAQKEAKMEVSLAKLEETWSKLEWSFAQFKDTDTYTIKLTEEDFELLEDNQVLVQGMIANRYMKTFEEPILSWNKKLMNVYDVNQIMSEIQRTWAYLESLFIHSEEVKKELPEAAARFKDIDTEIKRVLGDIKRVANVVQSSATEGLYKGLEAQQKQLELCEKALADYMESKRRAFPRFYFISTADLLDILSNGNNPAKVMPHMSKCFQAIEKLSTDEAGGGRPSATGMESCVGKEYVKWSKPMKLEGKVEEYMNLIIDKMRAELKVNLFDSLKAYNNPKPRHEWQFEWTSQMILVVSQIYWCQETEAAFAKMQKGDAKAMYDYNQQQVNQLQELIRVTRGDLAKDQRQKVMNMITIDAHSRDIIEHIANTGKSSSSAFEWLAQLRTYWDESIKDAVIKICDAVFPYGYEYLGNGPRLVITPLTDRIYITATQACWLSMGTAPAGPAGTGKTESTKDLSAQLGKSIYVFNCAPEMDYRTMGDIFKGLAASGSWGCFDEFNRLVPEVLSVCSVQYKCVTDAQKRKTMLPGRGLDHVNKEGKFVEGIKNYKFIAADGVEMPLEEGTSGFITMNPGYIGRAELPESLKALFRPITVMVPDRQLIMENMLMAEGFVEAKMLAKKFAALYYLLEDMLSPQKHYDWGLRAIKSVLVVAGSLLRAEEGQVEADVLFRALRDFNVPKILLQDMVIFMGLLNDLFPGTDPPRKRDEKMEVVIRKMAEEMNLRPDDDFVLRVVQMSDLLAIRHCVFLMGPTGVGRTEAYRVLAKTIEHGVEGEIVNDYLRMVNKQKVTIRDINPKSISTQEFYGFVNLSTREWKDGLMSFYMRELANHPTTDPKWILLDGDLDANWIESMNSVMDDNRLLTLPSNERIRLLPHMKLIFEIRDLKFATPATATRAGILYISEATQWQNFCTSWVKRVLPAFAVKAKFKDPEFPSTVITKFIDTYVGATIFEMKKSYVHITPLATMNWVTTLTNILEGMLKPENLGPKSDEAAFEQWFVLAMVWAFGGGLSPKDGIEYRRNFDKWWKQTWTSVKFPSKGSVYDYYINPKTGKFSTWSDLVADVEFNSQEQDMTSVFVPTSETSAFMYFLDLMLELRKPLMLVGLSGTGKTQLIKGKCAALPEDLSSLPIAFNYFTDVISFQKILESPLEKKAGINYGPPGQNRLIYFIDDMNMPKLDPYETAMPISLIRQHLGWGHWYDRAKLTQKNINNTQYLACMNPTAGAFTINPRLQRLFMTLAVEFPGQDSLMKIYGTFLSGHLAQFSEECQELGTKIIQGSLANHDKVVTTFRKTAVNFHYEFTVRHLANVFQGLLMSTPEQFNDPVKISRLWLHESERVYADRLVSHADLAVYNKNVQAVANKFFRINDLPDYYKRENAKPLIFSHFAGGLGDRVYNEVTSFESLSKILEEALAEYNETNAMMDLVLFEDALKHVCRISRIISNPGGHALLVGVGGSGKQSLSKLAAHTCGMSPYMIVISGSYNTNALKEDLQKMFKRAGLKGEGIMWLFTDSQITDEKFMVFINDLLASGEVPDLFPVEDKDEIINAIRGEVKGAGLMDTRENCWDFFISKCRQNLHMVFTCSPVGEQFRVRAQRFLAMINSTVIDWFQPWPERALQGVSKKFLDEVDLDTDQIKNMVVEFMPISFSQVGQASQKYLAQEKRFNYTTPKTFLELIKLYKNLLASSRLRIEQGIERLQNGLDKLEKTQKDVDVLVEQAKVKAVEVEEKVVAADAFAEKVGEEKEKAGVENAAANIEAAKCQEIAEAVAIKQASCEADLAAAEPLVDAALAALDTLNKKDLGEAKSLKKPPAGVDDVTAVILILLQNNPKDKSWQAAQKMMGNVDKFLETLKNFKAEIDAGNVSAKAVEACRPYLALPHFNRDVIYNKSRAAAGMCEYAQNIIKYFDVVTMIEPKRIELAEANATLAEANEKLATVQARVAELNALVAELERQFKEAEDEKNSALDEQARTKRKLELANRLINALAASAEQWKVTVAQMTKDSGVLIGDMLLAAAFVSYTGPFTAPFRIGLLDGWKKYLADNSLPHTEGIDPLKVLVDEAMIAGWVGEGLPSDRTSVENGTITTNSERWPLMCDPQLQGIAWIKERESKNNLQVVRMGAPKTLAIMEKAIEQGFTVLVENMGEQIDAVYSPVVTRATFKKGRSMYVKMGDKDVEYSKNFKLVLHTKMSNPHYPPEIQAETTLINFTVTQVGLEDQLLALVVNKERPDLEETKTELIVQNNEFTIKLKELEDTLLYKLATAEGDLTEDVVLIESLEEAKAVADEISVKVAESQETEVRINVAREKYRTAAARGSLLFFLLNSLNKVHAFYAFSLNAFVTVFARGIDNATGGKKRQVKLGFRQIAKRIMGKFDWNLDLLTQLLPSKKAGQKKKKVKRDPIAEPTDAELAKRMQSLLDTTTFTVFNYTRRGLFDRDKLIVSTLLTFGVLQADGLIVDKEMDMLIRAPKVSSPPPITDELSTWLMESQWAGILALEDHQPFGGIAKDMEKKSDAWMHWGSHELCETLPLPGEWEKSLTDFQRLLLLRAVRPDRITAGLAVFVEKIMGPAYVNQEAFNALTMFEESGPSTPMFFVLFPGYSPSKDVEQLAISLGKTTENGQLTLISMGQGQEPVAEGVLDKYTQNGGWVFLDNVHLMQGWIPQLERKLEIAAETAHKDFRCFFSAEPIAGAPFAKIVPESILQTCIKISNEPPSDMKSNMRRALAPFSQETFERSTTEEKKTVYIAVLFALCFYHSLLLGRKKFGVGIGIGAGSGLGYCRGYSFNMGDLVNCTEVLYNYLEGNDKVPWEDLRYMFGEVFYGGHITDPMDRKLCIGYLDVLVKPDLLPGADGSPPTNILAPGFKAPPPESYQGLRDYVEAALPPETPALYGLHSNAQLSLLTTEGEILFDTVLTVKGGGGGGAGSGSNEAMVRSAVEDMLERLPEPFNLVDIESRIVDKTPYVVCALQEVIRMNDLLRFIQRSLEELTLGLDGALNMSAAMELVLNGIVLNKVPSSWMAQMSTRVQEVFSLQKWFTYMCDMHAQLDKWTVGSIDLPLSIWLPGLFNAKAFVTSVQQVYARKYSLPLDVMKFKTELTQKLSPDKITEMLDEGTYIHGLTMEGARWDVASGRVVDSNPKELRVLMPVMAVVPVTADKYDVEGYYMCPVYMNMQRANVYSAMVGVFTLKTDAPPIKWTLASVAMLMQDELAV